jgi:Transposase domain (DUF772)
LFYEFSLEKHIPADHLLRSIATFIEVDDLRRELAAVYNNIGRSSVDPELMIPMLLIGYCFGIRSERRLCEEVHLTLAYYTHAAPCSCCSWAPIRAREAARPAENCVGVDAAKCPSSWA